MMGSQAINWAIHFASTIVLARVLTPEEYGVLAMVLAVSVFAGLFADLGLSTSTIQRHQLSHEQLSTLYWINVAAGAVLTVLVIAVSPLVALFYERPELKGVTISLAFSFVIGSFGTQQHALLARQMRFGRRAIAHIVSALTQFLITLLLALKGFSYWSLVAGALGGRIAMAVLLNLLSGWRPGPPRRRTGARSTLQYGMNVTGFNVVNYFYRNLDNILIGKFAGADALGLYSRAYNLLMFPIINLRDPIASVAFPAMSRLQHQPEDFRNYYCTVVSVLSLASMPIVGFAFVVSEPLIRLALGERWLGASSLFSILAVAAFLQAPASFRGTVLLSLGMGRRYFLSGVIAAAVTCIGFGVGIPWGAAGVATAYAITSLLLVYPIHVYCFRETPLRPSDFFRTIAPPVFTSVAAVAVTVFTRTSFLQQAPPVVDLGVSLVTFVIIYAGTLLIPPRNRQKLKSAVQFVQTIRSRTNGSRTVPADTDSETVRPGMVQDG